MIISFGNLGVQNLYPFLASISFVFRTLCMSNIKFALNEQKGKYLSPLFLTLTMFTAESIVGFIELFIYFNSSKRAPKTDDTERQILGQEKFPVIKKEPDQERTNMLYLFIVIIAFLDGLFVFIDISIEKKFNNTAYLSFQMRGFQILTLVVLSYYCLKQKIYTHQCFSIVVIICGFFLSTIMEVIQAQIDYYQIIFHSLNYIILASRDTTEKWLMVTKFILPNRLLFLQGLIGMIETLLLIGLSYVVNAENELFFIDIAQAFRSIYDTGNLWYFLGYFIMSTVYNLFYIHTKYVFSPILIAIGDSFSNITLFTIAIIVGERDHPINSSLVIAGYSVIFFGCLVYNEIVILHFCHLDIYTKNEINARGLDETIIINEEYNNPNDIKSSLSENLHNEI